MAGKKDGDKAEAAPGGKKKLIIVAALGAVLLAGGTGGGVFLLTKGDTAAAAATEEHLEPGDVTTLDAISLNLADGHYLKIGLALQAVASEGGGHGGSTELDGSKALDLTISSFSGLSMADLSNAEQRQHHKELLQEKIIEAYVTETEGVEHKEVMGIYFTQFVMQ
ncbi:flagellar basal body-associated FliL family protein [Paenibacillus sp. TRM 82003]|uniref:flagellar basal body-associated FliL family protein n=1 Tax=Kineococcus sp. TRM81007 TaxID=2925831 RepID=UPI001F58D31C|nr:flagellar basal body-associated FliL family protein [Kineococcus sp. TRM81007]MCI2240601.1 flagellar basal body-associated FliL family protein [Kineococcus sp. TRM81007]MCI3925477.1 flagellar basal body-associated FliL family protein [Paenibacillus sp. TRM 82003]